MALVLIDGFEDFSSFAGTPSGTIVAARNGNGLRFTTSGNTATFQQLLPAQESDTATVGFAIRYTALPSTNTDFFRLLSDATTTTHITLRVNSAGAIEVTRGGGTVLVSSVPALIPLNTWAYVELQTKLHDTTGFVTLRVNGITVAAATNIDTKNGGTKTTFDSCAFALNQALTITYDDFYLKMGTGDTFAGDIVVETLYPNGNGNANQWLGSDGDSVNNYLLVNETGTPNTTTYVGDSVSGHQDLYTLTDLVATTGTVVGVCHVAHAAKSDAVNTRQVKLVNRRAADTKSATFDLTTTYVPYYYTLAVDPETGLAFTIANVNALQSGIEVI